MELRLALSTSPFSVFFQGEIQSFFSYDGILFFMICINFILFLLATEVANSKIVIQS